MQDEGFKVPSHEAAHVLETARSLTKWTSDPTNVTPCLKFCDELCHNLQQCFLFQDFLFLAKRILQVL